MGNYKHVDLREVSSGGSSGEGLSLQTINIIEQNLTTQVDHKVGYTEITWDGEVPDVIEKWEDSSKAVKLFTITPVFTGDELTSVVTVNEDSGVITTKTIAWVDGNIASVTAVQS